MPAAGAGLTPDVVIKINGQDIKTASDLPPTPARSPEDNVKLLIVGAGTGKMVSVTLTSQRSQQIAKPKTVKATAL